MSKRLLSILICIILCFTLVGCGKSKLSFENSSDMEEHIYNGVWSCETNYNKGIIDYHYIAFTDSLCINLTLSRDSDQTLEDMFTYLLDDIKIEDFTFTSFAEFILAIDESSIKSKHISGFILSGNFKLKMEPIDLEPNNALVKETKTKVTYQFYDDNTMVTHGETYHLDEEDNQLETAFAIAYNTKKESMKKEFLNQYSNLANANQVKYNVYEYLGRKFSIEGTAELDDYFNFEYRDFEMIYFCIRVIPKNGSYLDAWYIYGDRSTHKELFERLQQGGISNITFIAEGYFPRALSNQMASLTDYFIG